MQSTWPWTNMQVLLQTTEWMEVSVFLRMILCILSADMEWTQMVKTYTDHVTVFHHNPKTFHCGSCLFPFMCVLLPWIFKIHQHTVWMVSTSKSQQKMGENTCSVRAQCVNSVCSHSQGVRWWRYVKSFGVLYRRATFSICMRHMDMISVNYNNNPGATVCDS